ncbi:MAG: BPSS1780 family membrane protein [Burkholderiales bacterium]
MRIVPARNGWMWLARGFALFRRSPATWLLLVFSYWLGVALIGEIRYLGPVVSTLLLPVFSVSFMVMCAALDRGASLKPAMLFSGFHSELPTLIVLGGLYLVSIAAALAIASLADGGALMGWVLSGREPSQEALRDGSVSRALLLAGLLASPVLMAFWFAPVLVAWDKMGALKSLFYSFFAGWRNWRAFLVYGAMLALVSVAFLVLVTITAVITRGQADLLRQLALLFTLFTLPTVFGSFYASYRDIFPEGKVPAEPAGPGAKVSGGAS